MALRVEDSTCDLAVVYKCERGPCWWTSPPPRLLCRACMVTVFGEEP